MKIVPDGVLTYAFNDVNVAYLNMQEVVRLFGVEEETRNGLATVIPAPVAVAHYAPWRRVLFDPLRDANPFFHYMEGIWMLTGSQNVDFPAYFAKNILQYSDDGVTLHGAYGHRWRYAFERDQIEATIAQLIVDRKSRRIVIAMWDPMLDLERDTKDLPCNTHLYFRVVDGRLNMTILNRSNDLVWGMLGANIVHMSMLQEYIAGCAEIDVGTMYQFTNNLHVYKGWEDKVSIIPSAWYQNQLAMTKWTLNDYNLNIDEAADFVEYFKAVDDNDRVYQSRIMRDNVIPMFESYRSYKEGNLPLALHRAEHIYDGDWNYACTEWLKRRVK